MSKDNEKREQKKPGRWKHIAAQILALAGGAAAYYFLYVWTKKGGLQVYDAILLGEIATAIATIVIMYNAFSYGPGEENGDPLREMVAKHKATWLHATITWEIVSIWMTITPLYCTCTTIYISGNILGGNVEQAGNTDQIHILVYSILSLVLSLGTYALRPGGRAAAYRRAYLCVTAALANTMDSGKNDGVAEAYIEGEEIIAGQETSSPQ